MGSDPSWAACSNPGPADTNAAVISYGLWQSQFAGDRELLGETINLNGAPYTIIGVMPPAFYFPTRDVQLWTPLTFQEQDLASRTNTLYPGRGPPEAGRHVRTGQGRALDAGRAPRAASTRRPTPRPA